MRLCLWLYNKPFTRQHYQKKKEFIVILAEHLRKIHSFRCGLNENLHVKQHLSLHPTEQKVGQSPTTTLKRCRTLESEPGNYLLQLSLPAGPSSNLSRANTQTLQWTKHTRSTGALGGEAARNSQLCSEILVTFLWLTPVAALVIFAISLFN